MASAAIHKLIPHSSHSHRKRDSNPQQLTKTPTQESAQDEKEHEFEKRQLAEWEDHKRPLSPSEKLVGHSAKHLRLEDFELLKTLGTGTMEC